MRPAWFDTYMSNSAATQPTTYSNYRVDSLGTYKVIASGLPFHEAISEAQRYADRTGFEACVCSQWGSPIHYVQPTQH